MSTPVIVWTVVVGMFVAIIMIRFAVEMFRYFFGCRCHGIFTYGSEREEFFVPGDPEDDEEDLRYEED